MDKETVTMSPLETVAKFPLIEPVVLFGKSFSTAYVNQLLYFFKIKNLKISSNGLISFDHPHEELIADPSMTHSVVLYPLHMKYNLTIGGSIAFRQIQGRFKKKIFNKII